MVDQMTLTIGEVIAALADIESIMNENSEMIAALDAIVLNRLPVAWECEAQRAYADVYVSYKNSVLPKFSALLATYKQTLNDTAVNLGVGDSEISKMVSSYMASQ